MMFFERWNIVKCYYFTDKLVSVILNLTKTTIIERANLQMVEQFHTAKHLIFFMQVYSFLAVTFLKKPQSETGTLNGPNLGDNVPYMSTI